MIVGVVGSRSWPLKDAEIVRGFVRGVCRKYGPQNVTFQSGGALGVDLVAENEARLQGATVVSFRPVRINPGRVYVQKVTYQRRDEVIETLWQARFERYRDALMARNVLVVQADEVAAFHHENSAGTWDARRKAEALGVRVHVYEWGRGWVGADGNLR